MPASAGHPPSRPTAGCRMKSERFSASIRRFQINWPTIFGTNFPKLRKMPASTPQATTAMQAAGVGAISRVFLTTSCSGFPASRRKRETALPAFDLAPVSPGGLNPGVRFGGRGCESPLTTRLAMTANIAAKPTQKAGEAAAHVQVAPPRGAAKGRCGRRSTTLSTPRPPEGLFTSFRRCPARITAISPTSSSSRCWRRVIAARRRVTGWSGKPTAQMEHCRGGVFRVRTIICRSKSRWIPRRRARTRRWNAYWAGK